MESNKTEEDKEGRFVSGTVIDALHVAKRVFQISADFTTLAHVFRANDALDERECVLKQHTIFDAHIAQTVEPNAKRLVSKARLLDQRGDFLNPAVHLRHDIHNVLDNLAMIGHTDAIHREGQ